MGRGTRQLRALLSKNFILKRRRWLSTLVEVALPMFVMFLLMYLHSKFEPTITEESYHLEHARNTTVFNNTMPNLVSALQDTKGKIALVTDGADNMDDVSAYLTSANFQKDDILYFQSNEDLDAYVAKRDYGTIDFPVVHAAITRQADMNSYELRFNASLSLVSAEFQGTPDTRLPSFRPIQKGYNPDSADLYVGRGFVELEYMLSVLTLHKTGAVDFGVPQDEFMTVGHLSNTDFFVNYIPFPTPRFLSDNFSRMIGGYLGIFFTLTFMWPITRIVSAIVEEKELRIKEGMKMMGLRDLPLILSWLITHLVMFIVTCFLIVIVSGSSIYQFSSNGLIYLYFFAFCVAVYGYSYFMSALFDRARVASSFSAIIFLAAFFLIYAVEGGEVTREVKTFACLSPAVCLALGATTISKLESSQIGVHTNTVSTVIDNFSYGDSVTMMFFDGILLFVLGLYLEQVLPSQYGLRRPWYFLFTPSFWCGSKKIEESDNESTSLLGENTDITTLNEFYTKTETPDPALVGTELVRIRHLRKLFPLADAVSEDSVFEKIANFILCRNKSQKNSEDDNHDDQLTGNNFIAVKDLSLDMYKDQIFTLLGHNGAGKTTTINMLTGLYAPTTGNARVLDYNITEGMESIRHNMGVCPQHDILYPYLTVREHLELYAELKNVSTKTRNIEIDEMIDAVGLGVDGDNKANSLAGSLSGGQMRKLSVGIALLGGSRIVYLDEPSSGMDVASQRHIWDLLMKAKKDRVIVLTTHFMEEAEIGDRIAIMAGGKLQCVGSSLFLKNAYGTGYSLTISKDTQKKSIDPRAIANFMEEHYPFAEMLSDAGGEISFRLPFSESKRFAEMFRHFEDNKSQLGFTTYGISVTTLTEVFLKVGHGYSADDEELHEPFIDVGSPSSSLNSPINSPMSSSVISSATSKVQEPSDALVDEDMYAGIDPSVQEVFGFERVKAHTKALFMKRWHNAKRDKNQWVWQVLYPGIILSLALLALKQQGDPHFPVRDVTPAAMPKPNPVAYPALELFPNPAKLMSASTYASSNFTPRPVEDAKFTEHKANENVTPWEFARYLSDSRDVEEDPRYNAVHFTSLEGLPMFSDGRTTSVKANIYFNTTAVDSLPVGLNTFVNSLLAAHHRQSGTPDTPAPQLSIKNKPFDRTNSELVLNNSSAATSIALAFAFVPATFAAFVVKERIDKGKHLQLISGVSPLAYWMSTFAWDLVNFIAPFIMGIVLLFVFDIKAALGEALPVTILNFWLFCISVAPFVYCLTFLFENHSAAQNMTLMLNFFLSVILIIVCIVMDIIPSTKGINRYLRFIYRLIPPFSFVEVFVNVFASDSNAIFVLKPSPWSFDVAAWPLLFQVFDFIIYTGILFLIEHFSATSGTSFLSFLNSKKSSDADLNSFSSLNDYYGEDPTEDSDVRDERMRIQGGMCNDATVVIAGLNKTYPPRMGKPSFTAVHNLFYSVEAGECFGFLGANGAGKTTTIKMLTGDEAPSKGTARLGGYDIINEPYAVRQLIGYCPQFDAIIGLMTAREHLEMYARIKCVPEFIIPTFVNRMLVKLGLDHLADRPAGTYSGGNKRKLSVGIALIGNPRIVFLDEPSTGMDPQARRFMWKLISSTMVGRSVILTTHSMEECEALCNRIGIMTRGKLRCFGNSQHLKSKFGQGFKLVIKAHDGFVDNVIDAIQRFFPGSECFELHGVNLKFKVPKANLSLAHIFGTLEANKSQVGIATYSVSDTDLEQIFVNFVREGDKEVPPHSTGIQIETNDNEFNKAPPTYGEIYQ